MKRWWKITRYYYHRSLQYLELGWLRTKEYLQKIYISSGFFRVIFFLKFLLHRYGPEQFNVAHVHSNFKEIQAKYPFEWLKANREGKIERIKRKRDWQWFKIKNALLFGAPQARVERSLYFTFLTLCLEVHNPFTLKVLDDFIKRKSALLTRAVERVKILNGKDLPDYVAILKNIELFTRSSILQRKVIKGIDTVARNQEEPPIVTDAKNALKMGLFPLLVIQGLSGTYLMRGTDRQISGLFKPFDEEAFAPNNPGGPGMQGALGKRRMRPGIRVGECAHREVAAFLVDDFFGFGIVPRTYYATFSHHAFFQAGVPVDTGGIRRVMKTKKGSFQEFIDGFIILNDLPREQWKALPEVEIQLLILLDVIVGNADRNTANILVGEDKIAAIDHGLCFADLNLHLATWYWKHLEHAKKPFPPSMVELLRNFPFEELGWKLRKECHIDVRAFERLRERVVLFSEGVFAGKTPFEMAELFSDENMARVYGLNSTLRDRCRELVKELKTVETEENIDAETQRRKGSHSIDEVN